MSVGPLVVELCAVFVVAALLLHRYGDYRRHHPLVTLGTLLAWYFPLTIVFVLPLDVSETLYRQCIRTRLLAAEISGSQAENGSAADVNHSLGSAVDSAAANFPTTSLLGTVDLGSRCIEPWTHVSEDLLPVLWRVVYWSSQALTWLILPFMQSYSNSGEFTVLGKVKAVVIANGIYYGTYLIVFCICLIYVATLPGVTLDAQYLKTVCITASNTWGLFLLMLLLGYGLVDVPRSLWWTSRHGHSLQRAYFRLAKLSVEKSEAQEKLDDTLQEVKRVAESVRYNNPLRKFVDVILLKCPEEFKRSLRRNDDYVDYEGEGRGGPIRDADAPPTLKSLVVLHKSVISAVRLSQRALHQWSAVVEETCELEDVAANESSAQKSYRPLLARNPHKGRLLRLLYSARLEWFWKCRLRRVVFAGAACLLAAFSLMVVWSECVLFVEQLPLSLFATIVNACHSWGQYLVLELVSVAVIAYLCVCAYSTVFKIRLFNYIHISPHHQTDEYSLIFSGTFLCRLTPPLCLNFLGLVRLDSHIIKTGNVNGTTVETAYTKIMGHLDIIHFIADGFNVYFPIIVVVLCAATLFRLGTRCLHCLGVQQFISNDDNVTQELVDEGRNLMRLERRRMERDSNREARRLDLEASGVQPVGRSSGASRPSSASAQAHKHAAAAAEAAAKVAAPKPAYSSAAAIRSGGLKASSSARPVADDRVELLRDQDVIDYDADEGGEADRTAVGSRMHRGGLGYGQTAAMEGRLPAPHRMFDDV